MKATRPAKPPSQSALKMRRYRERRRKGLCTIPIELHSKEVDGLIDQGFLHESNGKIEIPSLLRYMHFSIGSLI
jgi:hypothetical protein